MTLTGDFYDDAASFSYTTDAQSATIVLSYTADRKGLVCAHFDLPKKNSFSVWHNGTQLYSESYSLPQMLSICNAEPGDTVEIKITCKENENGTIRVRTNVLDETVFRHGYEVLSASTLELTSFSNTFIQGSIRADRSGILYTSIPQDGNWHAQVDGKDAEIVLIGDAMIGIRLSEGCHTVSFSYRNEAYWLGLKISLVCLLMFITAYVICYRPIPRRGKYQK